MTKILTTKTDNFSKRKILMDTFAQKAAKWGYKVETFNADRKVYKISKGNKFFFTVGKHFPFNSKTAYEIALRKDLTKQILDASGINVPKGILVKDWADVEKSLGKKKLNFPLVAKPNTAWAGKMVSPRLINLKDLKTTFNEVKKDYGEVLIEEYVPGEEHRFLVLDGKVIAVAKRVVPKVIGDGKKDVAQLIGEFKPMPMVTININAEIIRCLRDQGLTVKSVPKKGKEVYIRRNSNTTTGANAINLTEGVDQKFKDLAIKAAGIIGLRFAGVDIMTTDVGDKKSDYNIIEVNSDPGYDLHQYPIESKPYFAERQILKSLLK